MKWEYTCLFGDHELWRVDRNRNSSYRIEHYCGTGDWSAYTVSKHYVADPKLGVGIAYIGRFESLDEAKHAAELAIVKQELML